MLTGLSTVASTAVPPRWGVGVASHSSIAPRALSAPSSEPRPPVAPTAPSAPARRMNVRRSIPLPSGRSMSLSSAMRVLPSRRHLLAPVLPEAGADLHVRALDGDELVRERRALGALERA